MRSLAIVLVLFAVAQVAFSAPVFRAIVTTRNLQPAQLQRRVVTGLNLARRRVGAGPRFQFLKGIPNPRTSLQKLAAKAAGSTHKSDGTSPPPTDPKPVQDPVAKPPLSSTKQKFRIPKILRNTKSSKPPGASGQRNYQFSGFSWLNPSKGGGKSRGKTGGSSSNPENSDSVDSRTPLLPKHGTRAVRTVEMAGV
ncbi:hypothetical protein K439DRAFT_1658182 [Ramaria rubella]|nr:hypothetical protein K439DRAFT_1658182 [Ramaria rubella]